MKFNKFAGGNRGMIKSIKSAVWMIGMGYLFFTGNWWPGMFYLIGFSILLEVVLKLVFAATVTGDDSDSDDFGAPLAADELGDGGLTKAPVPSSNNDRMQRLDPDPIPPAKHMSREYRTDLLPPNCPNCGAPISQNDVEMVGIKTAKCSFCRSNFSLSK